MLTEGKNTELVPPGNIQIKQWRITCSKKNNREVKLLTDYIPLQGTAYRISLESNTTYENKVIKITDPLFR